jgi:hypothetical protein
VRTFVTKPHRDRASQTGFAIVRNDVGEMFLE